MMKITLYLILLDTIADIQKARSIYRNGDPYKCVNVNIYYTCVHVSVCMYVHTDTPTYTQHTQTTVSPIKAVICKW